MTNSFLSCLIINNYRSYANTITHAISNAIASTKIFPITSVMSKNVDNVIFYNNASSSVFTPKQMG